MKTLLALTLVLAVALGGVTLMSSPSDAQRSGPRIYTSSLTPTAVNSGGTSVQTFNVSGLLVGDLVYVTPPSGTVGQCTFNIAKVTAAGSLALHFVNSSGGSCTPAAGLYGIVAIKS